MKDTKDTMKKAVSNGRRQPSSVKKENVKKEVIVGVKEKKNILGCSVSKKCGGCAYMGMMYEQQLTKKEQQIKSLLKDICEVKPITGMENPYHYRNKVNAAFQYQKGGKIVSGIYQEGTHRVVNVDTCLIEDETADRIICSIRDLLSSFKIRVFDEDTGYGLLRHVMIRRGFTSKEVMVVLVVSSPIFPSKNNFVKALRQLHPEISTVVLNVNDKHTSMVLGERNIILYGKGYIEDQLCGLTFRISPQSFYQVNPVQTEKLYGKAIELAQLNGNEKVIDAYCGIGTIGLIASQKAGQVIGVELNGEAVKDAVINAKRNQVANIRFFKGDAGEFMVEMAEKQERADVVFMDPPRQGSDDAFLNSVVKLGPKKIVYISCGPETLARDLKKLIKRGYEVKEAWPYDMFCWTQHIETVCLLVKKS